jgi:HEAT repeat protein
VDVVLYSLNILDEIAPATLLDHLPGLLEHPSPEVRQEALGRIRQLGLVALLPSVEAVLKRAAVPQVQAEALRTLGALNPTGAVEEIYPYLEAADPVLKHSAIVGLLQNGSVEVTLMADGQVLRLANSPAPGDRQLAAWVIGDVAAPNLQQLLGQLLQDDEWPVRRAALVAAGQAAYPNLWPAVTGGLNPPETRRAAAAALVAGGEAALPTIETAVNQPPPGPRGHDAAGAGVRPDRWRPGDRPAGWPA